MNASIDQKFSGSFVAEWWMNSSRVAHKATVHTARTVLRRLPRAVSQTLRSITAKINVSITR